MGKHRHKHYSHGVRQKIYKMWKEDDWQKKYNAWIGDGKDVPLDYSDMLSRSKFCLVSMGG